MGMYNERQRNTPNWTSTLESRTVTIISFKSYRSGFKCSRSTWRHFWEMEKGSITGNIRKLTNLCCPFGTFQGFFASWKEKSAKRWKAPCPFCPFCTFCFHLYIFMSKPEKCDTPVTTVTTVTHCFCDSWTSVTCVLQKTVTSVTYVTLIIHHASIWYICLEFDEIDFKKNDFIWLNLHAQSPIMS